FNFNNVIFLPHGVDKNLQAAPKAEKKFEISFLGSCIDFEEIRATWEEKYSKDLCAIMDSAAESALSDSSTPYVLSFMAAFNKHNSESKPIDKKDIILCEVLDDLEMYIRGKDRVNLIKNISAGKIDIFGSNIGSSGWKKYLGNQNNVSLHG